MVEQLSLFGERDPAFVVAAWLKERNEQLVKVDPRYGPLDKYVLGNFSHYAGGTAHGILAEEYFAYDFSPKGCRLQKRESGETVFVKKSAILRLLGIRDDHGDIMRGESYERDGDVSG